MPGFCGILGEGCKPGGKDVLEDMCRMLVHTGEQRAARYGTEGLAMAVVTMSDALSSMPFVEEDIGLAALVEGEIYNLNEVLEDLQRSEVKVSIGTAEEAAMRVWQVFGRRAAARLNGAFNAFIWDKFDRKLTIMNDRLGLRPLYYTRIGGNTYFASEFKAFTAIPGFHPSLDYGYVYQFLKYGFPLGEVTIAEEVSQLPMATVAEFSQSGVKMTPYWGPEHWPDRKPISHEEALKGFIEVFSRAQMRALRDGRRKGILLSGGIDSRLIAADAAGQSREIETFTFGEEGCLDAKIAGHVARELGLVNRFHPFGPDTLTDKSLEICWLSDGMYNIFHAHGVSTYPEIAKHVKVVLSGMEHIALYLYEEEIRSLSNRSRELNQTTSIFRYLYEKTHVPLSNGNDGLFTAALDEQLRGEKERVNDVLSGAIVVLPSGELDVLRTLEWMGLRHRQRRFTLMGQMMMRNWLEVRAPLMDSDVLIYTMSLGDMFRAEEKPLHVGWLQAEAPALLRIAWQRTGRAIQGSPLDDALSAGTNWVKHKVQNGIARFTGERPGWTRKKLADYHMWLVHDENFRKFVRAVLMSPRTLERGLYSRNVVKRMLEEEFSDKKVHTELIGRMITLELAMRLFFDGDEAADKHKGVTADE